MSKENIDDLPINIQSFLDIAGVMFVALDAGGKVRLINRKGCEILGCSEDQIIGKDWFLNFVPEKNKKEVREVFDKLIQEKMQLPDFYINPVLCKNGELKVLAFHNTSLRDKQGKIVGVLSSGEDITERVKARERLKQERAIFKAIVDNIPVMITRYDPEQNMLYLNREFEEKIGWKSKELKDVDLTNRVFPDPEYRRMVSAYMEKSSVEWREFRLLSKSGETVESEWSNIRLEDGTQIGIGIDTREQKKNQEILRQSKERYRALFDRSLDSVFIHDFYGNLIDANQTTLDRFGFSKEEIKSINFIDLIADKKQVPRMKKALKELRETSRQKEATQFKLKTKSGKIIWVETEASVIYEEGKPQAVQEIARDITKRKLSEKQIKENLHEKEILLREIHHRVKNNMQVIISLLRIQSSGIKDKKYKDFLKTSQERIYSMVLIHDKLYQSKNFDRVAFAQYIKSFVTHLFHTYNYNSDLIKLSLDLEEIKFDINRAIPLGLILNELVSNVLKHAFPEGRKGKLSIRLFQEKTGKNILLISDNGVGIPAEIDIRNSKTFGLQIVHDLVRQIKGSMQINTENGTEIKITF